FPARAQSSSKILICHFDEASMRYGLALLTKLRAGGIASEIYPDSSKLKKQLEFANKKGIAYTIIVGSEEIATGKLALKNMTEGKQEMLTIDEVIQRLK